MERLIDTPTENLLMEEPVETIKQIKKPRKSTRKRAWKSGNLPHVFTVRADEEEYTELKKMAAATGWSLSRLLIEAALYKRIRTQEQAAAESEKVEEMIFQMRRIGINLNQITAALNATRRGPERSFAESKIELAAEEVERLIRMLRKRL